ncbi:hypothetical protein JG688_00010245 [Phytophthora aleatoria]|uniref:Uncharacterized protein n=1 Tax=Phytophthora aleatoria TaxID=2496075 RepID=A0A8J5M1U2_9STRA|nr:hypothetical protein JG688_00010245 [Phytophthora aleatoria]
MKPPPPKFLRNIRQGQLRRIQCSRATGERSVALVKASPTEIFDGNGCTRPNDLQEASDSDCSSVSDSLSGRWWFERSITECVYLIFGLAV